MPTLIILSLFAVLGFAQAQDPPAPPADNMELHWLHQQDQADRTGDIDWNLVAPRDEARQKRVRELLDAKQVVTSKDHYHAAMVFQHGPDAESALLAHTLAKTAVELDPTNAIAKWLSAASWDRYKMRLGEPQWYGTQFVSDEDGTWILYDVDTTAVTDAMRKEHGVPSLEESRARAKSMNQ